MALVDSGNSAQNAISASLADELGLTSRIEKYQGPELNTAKKGSSLKVKGLIRKLSFRLFDWLGRKYLF